MAFTTIQGSGANDATTFVGSSGVDFINFAPGTDSAPSNFFLGAQEADDIIQFTSGKTYSLATLRGGDGNDAITLSGDTAGTVLNSVSFNGNAGDDTINLTTATKSSTIFGSTIHGGQGKDSITVASLNGTIVNGNKDNDTIIVAGTNNDTVNNSSIYGGQGADTITVGSAGGDTKISNTVVQGNDGNDAITLKEDAVYTNVTVNGNDGDDIITVEEIGRASKGVTLFGGQGNDKINASAVIAVDLFISDTVGNNSLTGGTGKDTIIGGEGNDTITGGFSADRLTGGGGNNQFNYTARNQGGDIITDFTVANDRIGLTENAFFVGFAQGALTAANFATATTVAQAAGSDYDNNAVLITTAQNNAAIYGATNDAFDAVFVVFNSDLGFAQVVYDGNWNDTAGRVTLANLTNLTSAASIAGITQNNFFAL